MTSHARSSVAPESGAPDSGAPDSVVPDSNPGFPILRPAVVLFTALTLLTGVAYPIVGTGLATVLFPWQARGSLIEQDGTIIGSVLIGQSFTDPRNLWGRPSATSPMANNAANSGGSNLGPSNPALIEAVKTRIASLRAADPGNKLPIPVDLVTASASGVDPHISVAGAMYQAGRIARARNVSLAQVQAAIDAATESRLFGFLGEPRVNVLAVNIALARIHA